MEVTGGRRGKLRKVEKMERNHPLRWYVFCVDDNSISVIRFYPSVDFLKDEEMRVHPPSVRGPVASLRPQLHDSSINHLCGARGPLTTFSFTRHKK